MSLEEHFSPAFAASLALREKQIQQNYRPIIGIHKWFARRPGTVFRSLLLAEFNGSEPLDTSYWRAHKFQGVLADPFMGGGTPLFEANRLGFGVVGADTNPMAWWIVRQSLTTLDLRSFSQVAEGLVADTERLIGDLYETECPACGSNAKVKYFLWVKTQQCPICEIDNDLFPGYLLAEAVRHPRNVLLCSACGALNEYDRIPTNADPLCCSECKHPVAVEGPARRQHVTCRGCGVSFRYPALEPGAAPRHRMWALEYHCERCKPNHKGRFFKRPTNSDLARFEKARTLLQVNTGLPVPHSEIPAGDETNRLHRWGYRRYREMFSDRQLFGLGLLLQRIQSVEVTEIRHALLTVFSDFLRYQNMLCRYDTYALKCQDIFSVHGFPVGLVQCENSLLGIPGVGAGGFRHYIEKYLRAKQYCETPFETSQRGRTKREIPIEGEHIQAALVQTFPSPGAHEALLAATPAAQVPLPPGSLDGVFTDPPYFDNVQYAELMDFCFVWLRLGLRAEFTEFLPETTRSSQELTGNQTLGRGLHHFTNGLSAVFRHYGAALKPGAPFVFTYHHNDPTAYVPLVVAILDAGMDCTTTLPTVAEMSASLHILGTESSCLDSVFVCRMGASRSCGGELWPSLVRDVDAMKAAAVHVTAGDIRCLAAGHAARVAINRLRPTWDPGITLSDRMRRAKDCLEEVSSEANINTLSAAVLGLDKAAPSEVAGVRRGPTV